MTKRQTQNAKPADLGASLVRTVVPIVVGVVIRWATRHDINLSGTSSLLTTLLTGGFSAAYFTVARLAEHYLHPVFGWLLGYAKPPAYSTTVKAKTGTSAGSKAKARKAS